MSEINEIIEQAEADQLWTPRYEDELIQAYGVDGEFLTHQEAFEEAYRRDQDAAHNLEMDALRLEAAAEVSKIEGTLAHREVSYRSALRGVLKLAEGEGDPEETLKEIVKFINYVL